MDENIYDNYFKKQYKLEFDEKHILLYKKWFRAQWYETRRHFSKKKQLNILEIGSGIGTLYSFIHKDLNNPKYIGLELDKNAVNFANNYFKVNVFKNNKFEEFKTKEKFDLIFAYEVLEHVDDPVNVINKIYSLLKKEGKFIGTSPYPFEKNVNADKSHKFVLHPSNWVNLFKGEQFKKVEVKPMSFIPYLWRLGAYLNYVIPFYLPFPYFISTTLIVAKK